MLLVFFAYLESEGVYNVDRWLCVTLNYQANDYVVVASVTNYRILLVNIASLHTHTPVKLNCSVRLLAQDYLQFRFHWQSLRAAIMRYTIL